MTEVKVTLPEILAEWQAIERDISLAGGELTPEIEQRLAITEQALREKTDGYVFIEERLEMNEEFFKRKADAFSAIAKRFKQARDRLRGNVKALMLQNGLTEIKGKNYRYVLKRTNPALIIEDEKALPDECLVTTVETKPNKDMIKGLLKDGQTVPGAKLQESYSLQPYEVTHE